MVLLTSFDGSVHLFSRKRLLNNSHVIQHQRYDPYNRTFTSLKNISGILTASEKYNNFSKSQVSINENHIVVVYVVDKDMDYDMHFAESYDGGSSWSKPIYVANNTHYSRKVHPLVALEDTGRVYVAYNSWFTRRLAVKKPGTRAFSSDMFLYNTEDNGKGVFGFSYNRERSKKYLHFIWQGGPNSIYKNGIYYIRSSDSGSTWPRPTVLVLERKTLSFLAAAVGIDGGLFAQIVVEWEFSLKFEWSTDHGKTWRAPQLYLGGRSSNDFAMCEKGS
eukprot:TRINITY_DN498_c0_g6_i1.p1 TRINITY_DN498_c0_g6~~TRINITY_DN498_c0_g6_i1.p1  ORF type:complete len:276 (-),score=-0.90 TRINITY_DN498_c0_g6_i1:300-1127(-)